jgi:hypothetical protein
MRRPRTASGLLPVVGVVAALAGPVAAESGPRPLSLGDLQGFAIRSAEPRQLPPVATAPAVEVVAEPVVEVAPRPAPRPAVAAATEPDPSEDELPGIIIRAGQGRPLPGAATPPTPAPTPQPAPIVALAPSPGEALVAIPQPRPTPVIGGLPEPRPVPAPVWPRARPAAPESGPASLGTAELQAIALTPGGRATSEAPAAPPPAPEPAPVAAIAAAPPIARVATVPPPPVTEAKGEPATPPRAGPVQLGTDALVAVGLRAGGGAETR